MSIKHLSGVRGCFQPASEVRIGNHFGAIENWALQEPRDCRFGIANLRAVPREQRLLKESTKKMIDLSADGFDPDKPGFFISTCLFVTSDPSQEKTDENNGRTANRLTRHTRRGL